MIIGNAKVFVDGHFQDGSVTVEDGRITAIGGVGGPCDVDAEGRYLVPGFVDVHTHGGAGVDINAAGQADLEKLSAFFASQGVTSFLASILTDTVEATERAIDHVCTFMDGPAPGARCLGIHLEGPFLCLKYKGAMPPELLREGDAGYPAYLAALEDLFGQFSQNGLLLQPNETLVYAGAPAVEAPERSTY